MTIKQQNDIECIKWFIPETCKNIEITDKDIEMFLEYSDRGLHKDKVGEWAFGEEWRNGFNALIAGKRWRGIHIHEMYEDGVLDGSVPYFTLLGGDSKEEIMPRVVVDFLKKEMFKGKDTEIIEKCYQNLAL